MVPTDDIDDGYVVVRNDLDQYSIWWQDREVPAGWIVVGSPGSRSECLDRIGEWWTDMRPVPVRAWMTDGPEPA